MRVLVHYKSREAQAGGRGIGEKLFPDQETFRKEEQQRWRLTKAHWDRPLTQVDPHVEKAESLAGLWNATIDVNGADHENSTGGKLENGSLVLRSTSVFLI